MKRRWPKETIEKAILLRKQGSSFGQLTKEFGVAKSTLHMWVRGVKRPEKFTKEARIRWIREIQPMGAKAQHIKREKMLEQLTYDVHKETQLASLSRETQKAMLSMLYWVEGAKGRGTLIFTNTDPKLMALFVVLLRNCYEVDEKKFRVRLHLHWYHKESAVKKFWSELLNIPEGQFNKTYHKQRSKERVFRKNVGGICFLKYNSDYLRERILRYGYALEERITRK